MILVSFFIILSILFVFVIWMLYWQLTSCKRKLLSIKNKLRSRPYKIEPVDNNTVRVTMEDGEGGFHVQTVLVFNNLG